MSNDFFQNDSCHGLAKRIALYRYFQAQVGRAFNTRQRVEDYNITYLDGFSGTGLYENNVEEGDVNDSTIINEETCPFNKSFGSPLVALEALWKHITEQKVTGIAKALFVFIEKNKDRYDQLQKNVKEYITYKKQLYNQSDTGTMCCNFQVDLGPNKNYHTNNIELKIEYHNCEFLEFHNETIKYNQPMVSFFDPFGFSDTPMRKVMEYAGDRQSIVLNLMVRDINRFGKLEINKENLALLFGSDHWQMDIFENSRELSVTEKMRKICDIYCKNFKNIYREQNNENIRISEFSIRRGSSKSVDKNYIYYLLFVAVDLTAMKSVKYALHTAAQNFKFSPRPETISNELYFADFYFRPDTPWRPREANELIDEEADVIYQNYKGQVVTFGELKEWVIMETPYQCHSDALRNLEKNRSLIVISTDYDRKPGVPKYERKKKAFPGHVGKNNDDPDWDNRLIIKYCNGWVLKFNKEDEDANSAKTPRKGAHETPDNKSSRSAEGIANVGTKRKLFLK